MKVFSAIGRFFKPFVDVRTWTGYDLVKDNAKYIKDLVKGTVVHDQPEEPPNKKTFDKLVKSLGLSEDNLKERAKTYKQHALIYLTFSILILFYAVYLIAKAKYLAGLVSLLLVCLGLANTFRTHFWAFQIERHEKQCTVKDWFLTLFKRVK